MKRLQSVDRGKLALGGLGLAVMLLFAVNIFSNASFQSAKLDLTQGKLFTLSQGTRNVLKGIDEPITLKLYYTKLLGERSPQHANLFERVRELLSRYADLSGGRIRLELLHPEPFSDAEDRAVAGGLQGVPINSAGDLGYFGLTGNNTTDDQVVIPFFTTEREAFLEYDLTKMVFTLANPARQVVGVMSPLPLGGGDPMRPPFQQSPRWAVLDQVNEFFQVLPVPASYTEIPDNVDILMVVHPHGLSDATLYAIDQFVLRGGRVLAFVDANAEVDAMSASPAGPSPRSDFDKLLNAWGVKLVENKIAGDLDAARRVNVRVAGKTTVADYVAWLTLSEKNFDTGDAVIGDIGRLNVASAGILEKTGVEGIEVTPLIRTGARSMAIDAAKVAGQPDVVGMFRDFKPGGAPLTLAARIKGTVKSAFPDGPPPPPKLDGAADAPAATSAKAPHRNQSDKPANLIVVADADMLHDRFWTDTRELMGRRLLVPFANNADFVVNALDNLSGSDAMIGLRGRAQSTRPFHLVQEIRQAAEQQYRSKEQSLQVKLEDVRQKLEALERRRGTEGDIVLSAEDRAAIDKFRSEMIATRKELRDVQRALREDIDRMDAWLKFLNIAAIPLLLGLGTIVVTMIERLKRKIRAVPA
ncbi:MAG: Gldg family protein [Rhodospirillales bacterium]|nr:Gldg family protein [Rhodospirillales bacterium]